MGPTASGKSALAIHLAQELGGVILNADAMQCYDGLPMLTAQPSQADKQAAPHALYGIWPVLSHGHAMRWQQAAADAIDRTLAAGKLPILVGGTGMYVKLLSDGMAPVPEIDSQIRAQVRAMNVAEARAQLQQHDPIMAARLKAGDTHRIARALEVVLHTGKSLAQWQQLEVPPLIAPERFIYAYIDIPRELLYERINLRFDQMMQSGVLDEVRGLLAQLELLPHIEDFPILHSHGFPELADYLQGKATLEDAIIKAKQHTRNYAKRQVTWIRNQLLPEALAIPFVWQPEAEEIMLRLREMIDRRC